MDTRLNSGFPKGGFTLNQETTQDKGETNLPKANNNIHMSYYFPKSYPLNEQIEDSFLNVTSPYSEARR